MNVRRLLELDCTIITEYIVERVGGCPIVGIINIFFLITALRQTHRGHIHSEQGDP